MKAMVTASLQGTVMSFIKPPFDFSGRGSGPLSMVDKENEISFREENVKLDRITSVDIC